jgi:hypothetical protein
MLALPPIGTIILYKGRAYRFCGITPASVQPARALLQDRQTGSWSEVTAVALTANPAISSSGR